MNRAIQAACQRYTNVDETLVWALMWEESKYDPLALGSKGEVGLGQLMSRTAEALGVRDRTDVNESVTASVKHLSYLLTKYKNNTRLALGAYNAGEPAVNRCKCVPAASRPYVSRIDQNRFFARRIVEYVQQAILPVATHVAQAKQLEERVATLQTNIHLDASARTELGKARETLQRTQAEADALRAERDRLQSELRRENSVGAQALVMTDTLRQRLELVEKQINTGTVSQQNGTEAFVELADIKQEVADLKAAIEARNVQDSETQRRIAELAAAVERASDKPLPIAKAAKKSSTEPPTVALVTASSQPGTYLADSALSGVLQDALLKHGLGVNVELETPEFLTRNLNALIAGHGEALKKSRAKHGPNWNYVVVVRLVGKPNGDGMEGTTAYRVIADSRLYSVKGDILGMQTFSETGAGFSEAQARDAATARVGRVIAEYVSSALPR